MISTSSVALQKAHAYLNRLVLAGATLTNAQRTALTALAKALDGIGVTKFSAVYPLFGATAACHALDLMGAYDITWSGSLTHNANGVTGDGTTGYGDTAVPSDVFTYNAACIGAYVRTAAVLQAVIAGQYAAPYFGLFIGAGAHQFVSGSVGSDVTGSSTSTGHFIGVGNTSTLDLYRNGASVGQDASPVSATFSNASIRLLRTATGTALYSTANVAFAHIGTPLTAGEALTLYTAVQAYQTALARNV